MGLGPRSPGGGEAVADLDTFHGLDAHECEREPRVELAVVVHVGAQARRRTEGHHLEYPAHRVARLPRSVDLGNHLRGGGRVEAPHRRRVHNPAILRTGKTRPGRRLHFADLDDVREHLDAQLGQECLAEVAQAHPGRGFAGAGTLQHVPNIAEAVLHHAG